MNPAEVIAAWGELTGEKWRLVPYTVGVQASEFAGAGFTREEMELVVRYTQRMIAHEEGGFNAQSITWRVMAADQWQKFQERLALASKTRLGRRILNGTVTEVTPVPRPQIPAVEQDDLRKRGAEALRKFREGGR
ncbi:MAG TPA: hypothetical protein VK961_06895 [Chthoniobacter sp.]|nr:hypothetical protein [Chthoniobacter sp.]